MAAKKNKLFKSSKEAQKTLQHNALRSVVAAGTGVLTEIAYNFAKQKVPEKARKYTGLGLLAIGGAGTIYAKDGFLEAASLAVCSKSGGYIVDALASDDFKAKIGLTPLDGIGAAPTNEELAEIEKLFEDTDDDYDEVIDEYDEEFDD